ncbi:SH3-domain-containing protein [Schizopora paradoxa]|uniref:SH3-domain-containing protein n=1 Tax=Schizopora paradoxa TaxID=27342 RepID=A0A0H2RNF6_9AGAM|nr:SH3-domain-containing protein [Schizopora paradoxa]
MMPQPTNPQNTALVAHIAQQTRANLDFLVGQNYIQASEASGISRTLGRLANNERGALNSSEADSLVDRAQNMALNDRPPSGPQSVRRSVPPPPRQAPAHHNQARALWDYTGDESRDLSFKSGDTIDIISEDNPDWWTGRVSGTTREGLIPANYLEKISPPQSNIRSSSPNPPRNSMISFPSSNSSFPPSPASNPPRYAPPSGPPPPEQQWQTPPPHWQAPPPQSYYSPPPPGPIMNDKVGMYAPPPMAPIQVMQAPLAPPPQEPKKSKFGGLGSTLATSAAGGLGFGAGAAIGGDIVNSIF